MKPIRDIVIATAFFAGLATAIPCVAASITLADATITTSLAQCVVQTCGGGNPNNLSYAGTLAGYSTQTVGEGANVTATGFSSPTITSTIPSAGANAIAYGTLQYFIEVVPNSGATGNSLVSLGVNATGSISATTTGGAGNNYINAANPFTFIQLELTNNSDGSAVFNDSVSFDYAAGPTDSGCSISTHGPAVTGAASVTSNSVACGGSTVAGAINDHNSYGILTNQLYLVTMTADLNLSTGNNGLAQGTGSVAGIATVDPIFTVPNGYSLAISAGVGNGATSLTPEPATWWMLGAGLILLIIRSTRCGVRVRGISDGREAHRVRGHS